MADYFTRVELHRADSDDYDVLHAAMKDAGFFRAVRGHDGKVVRQLPTATYHKSALTDSASTVRDQAKAAADQTGKKSKVLTVESSDWAGNFGF